MLILRFLYLLSIIYLIVSFLRYKKTTKKISIVTSSVYSLVIMFCYNIIIVTIYSFLGINGNLGVLSLFNLGIGSLLNVISYKRDKYQEYYFDKKELLVVISIGLIVLFLGIWRFKGFSTINYETGDPAVHYRHALTFEREFEILTRENSKDLVYEEFSCVMPISYVNGGILMRVLSFLPSYQAFIIFDTICLLISSLLFFITIFNVLKKKKYLYSLVLTIIYLFGFPLNNLLFGFLYMGLGVSIVNLLYLTVVKMDDFKEDIIFKLILLFIICYSVFFSYFLFVPCVYLTLGIYYIYLWKKKKLTFKELLLYGIITLVIPFILGMIKLVLPGIIGGGGNHVFKIVTLDGYIYNNKDPIYFFLILIAIFNFKTLFEKDKTFLYFKLNFIILYLYILLFYLLYVLDISSQYYFYKLFYLFWVFGIVYIGKLLYNKEKYLYVVVMLFFVITSSILVFPDNSLSFFLEKNFIYGWNIKKLKEDKTIYEKEELEIIKESVKHEDTCEVDREFLITGNKMKNVWYYSYTSKVPVYGYIYNDGKSHLEDFNISYDYWSSLPNYKCLIYFYEGKEVNYDKDDYEILYENNMGAILKKK